MENEVPFEDRAWISWGKYKGKQLTSVPSSYLLWLVSTLSDKGKTHPKPHPALKWAAYTILLDRMQNDGS